MARAGLKLLDQLGLEGLTVRAIATELGVQAPTLYWRFRNKQDLIDEMASQLLADHVAHLLAMKSQPLTWPHWTKRNAQELRTRMLKYRDGARMLAGTRLTNDAAFVLMEKVLGVFALAGIKPDDAVVCLKTVNDYTIGFTIEQQATDAITKLDVKTDPIEARNERFDRHRFPLAQSIGGALFSKPEALFDASVDLIIGGFARGLPKRSQGWLDFKEYERTLMR